jgi:V/A-type H+-transporting ATPase subunit D
MNEATPTRSAALALREQARAMREGHAFLDEKCLVLAGAMLRELRRFDAARSSLEALRAGAAASLAAAIERHGLQGLQCQPALDLATASLAIERASLLGVERRDARLEAGAARAPDAVYATAEAAACRSAFAALLAQLAAMAAMSGNLARLEREYRRTVRRVRALEDVLITETVGTLAAIEDRLEELDREEAQWSRAFLNERELQVRQGT